MRTILFKDIRFVLIFSIVLLDIIGIGIIFPIIPDLLKDVGIAQNASAAFWAGLLSSSYAFMQFVFSPTLGAISDIFGRRPVLLTASLLLALDYLVMGFAEPSLFCSLEESLEVSREERYLQLLPIWQISRRQKIKKKNFAVIGAAFGLGFILGPVIGGLVGEIDYQSAVFLISVFIFFKLFSMFIASPRNS